MTNPSGSSVIQAKFPMAQPLYIYLLHGNISLDLTGRDICLVVGVCGHFLRFCGIVKKESGLGF